MKAINIVFIFVLTISLAGCSIMGSNAVEPENAEQNQDGENQDEKSDMSLSDSIDLYDMDMQTRIELGIALDYSPDGRHFFIKDKYGSNFIKVFLYEDGEKEIEIYDYCDFFGIIDLGARDMTEDRFFWGGMSDTIYLHALWSDTLRLWAYTLSDHKWEKVHIPSIKSSNFVTSVYNTNKLLIKEGEKYCLVDVFEQTKEELNLPGENRVIDQNNSAILVSRWISSIEDEIGRIVVDGFWELGIYDIRENLNI